LVPWRWRAPFRLVNCGDSWVPDVNCGSSSGICLLSTRADSGLGKGQEIRPALRDDAGRQSAIWRVADENCRKFVRTSRWGYQLARGLSDFKSRFGQWF